MVFPLSLPHTHRGKGPSQRKHGKFCVSCHNSWQSDENNTNLFASNFRTIRKPKEGNSFYSKHQTDCKHFGRVFTQNTIQLRVTRPSSFRWVTYRMNLNASWSATEALHYLNSTKIWQMWPNLLPEISKKPCLWDHKAPTVVTLTFIKQSSRQKMQRVTYFSLLAEQRHILMLKKGGESWIFMLLIVLWLSSLNRMQLRETL